MKIGILLLISITTTLLSANCLQLATDIDVGECYEKEGNSNLAQAAYERALLEDSDDAQARLKLAALYKSMQMDEQADSLLVNINDTQLTPQQRTSLASLKQMEQASTSQFRARASIDVGYDSNINVNPISDISAGDPIATIFSRYQVDLSYLHDLSSVGGWFLRTDANLYYQNNISAHDYDATYGRLYAGAGYRGESYSLYIPVFYDRLHYLDRDLLQQSGIRPDLNFQLNNTFILNINGSYSARRYIHSYDQDRDDNMLSAEAALFWLDNKDMAYIKTRYDNYSAVESDPRPFTDKNLYYFAFGGIYSIQNIFDLRMQYQYRFGDFTEVTTFPGSDIREDHNHDAKFALERDIFKQLRLRVQYRFIDNQSNDNLAEYTKHETLIGLVYNY